MKNFNREAIKRMFDGRTGGGGVGSNGADLAGYATQMWVNQNYVSIEFFNRLFSIHGHDPEDESTPPTDISVLPNDMDSIVDSIESMVGFWTEEYLSALGLNSEQGGGGITLNAALASINNSPLGNPTGTNTVLMFNGTTWVYAENGSLSIAQGPGISITTNNGVKTISLTSGVATAGTYKSVTVDTYGRVTAGTNPTTLAGYGITDALASNTTFWGQEINQDNIVTGDICMDNDDKLKWSNSSSVLLSMITLSSSNEFVVGESCAQYGYTTYLRGRQITFQSGYTTGAGANNNASLDANGLFSVKKLKIGNIVIEEDTDNSGLRIVSAGLYADTYISALGTNSGGGGGGFDLQEPLYGINTSGLGAPSSGTMTGALIVFNGTSWSYSHSQGIYALSIQSGGNISATGNFIAASGYGFKVTGKDNNSVLLAGGGTAALSDIGLGSYVTLDTNQTITGAKTYKGLNLINYYGNHRNPSASLIINKGTAYAGIGHGTNISQFVIGTCNGDGTWINQTLTLSDGGGAYFSHLVEAPAFHVKNYNDNSYLIQAGGGVTKLKTVNGYSLFGEGNIDAAGGIAGNYLPLDGGTMTGVAPLVFTENKRAIDFRPNSVNYNTYVEYMTSGNEALVIANALDRTSFIFKCGLTLTNTNDWTGITPSLQIKGQSVYINELIANNVTPDYNFKVNGTACFMGQTKFREIPTVSMANGCYINFDSTNNARMQFGSNGSYAFIYTYQSGASGGGYAFLANYLGVGIMSYPRSGYSLNVGGATYIDGNLNVNGGVTASSLSNVGNIDSLLYFDTTNNRVGIGTSSPSEKLAVSGNIIASGFKVSGATAGLLKYDGTLDTTSYVTSTQLSDYLPLECSSSTALTGYLYCNYYLHFLPRQAKAAIVINKGGYEFGLGFGTENGGFNNFTIGTCNSSASWTKAIITIDDSGNTNLYGTLSVTGAATLSSTLSVANTITLTGGTASKQRIYFDSTHYIELDSSGYFHFSHGVYSDGFVSALGLNSGGGGAADYIPLSGSTNISGSLTPSNNNSVNLGAESKRWASVYCTNLRAYGASSISANLTMAGNITPMANNQYALGTSSAQFGNAFVRCARIGHFCIETDTDGNYSSSRSNEINNYNGVIHLQYNSTNGVTLAGGGGNVAVGTTSVNASYKLFVSGSLYCSSFTMSGLSITGNGERFDINTNNGAVNLPVYVTGTWYGTFQNGSDIRLKSIHKNIDSVNVNDLSRAPIFDFTWIDGRDKDLHLGSSAQFWRDIFPNAISTMYDGHYAMDYGATALAAAVITARKVVDHEARIRLLEVENAALRNEINQLKKVA